ncbi:hypothetical protein QTO34_008064 [Cnephaeus nilssonii]|uniref:Retroviral nucleocapsid Gag protein p24 C-terminal domain-containing protein n=1 Tax=Cnephaeus nilssonii TaxID=3371016 RepID=A0AA40LVV4_CNENI|nr:hypothetical protein QTO34_008064 [Eptesicus nilssonii]
MTARPHIHSSHRSHARFNRQAGPDNWHLNRSLRTWDTEGEELLRKKECTRKGKKEKQCTGTKKGSEKDSILKKSNVNFKDKLNPQNEEDLEEATALCHDDDTGVVQAKEEEDYFSAGTEEGSNVEDVLGQFLEALKRLGKKKRSPRFCAAPVPLSPLQMALQEARKAGEDLGIHAFPVIERAVGRVVVDGEAGMLIVKQLAYENANAACQAALRPYQRKGDLSDYIRICADIGPSYIQGVAIAAALKGTTIKGVLQQQFSTGRGARLHRWQLHTVPTTEERSDPRATVSAKNQEAAALRPR